MKETDLYNPIKNMLTAQGFTVRGEVKGCDIAATRDDTLWIIEMKLSANLTLIYQALNRKMATGWVFVAIPRPKRASWKNFLKLQSLLKKLELGLITVALDSPVKHAEIVIFPQGHDAKKTKKSTAIKTEMAGRSADTTGGATRTAINTAYREKCIQIACALEASAPTSPKNLRAQHGLEKNLGNILYSNFLGWFNRPAKGLYELSPKGQAYLKDNAETSLVMYYRSTCNSQ
ncbi:MAG: DUF2161 family putative PD-(D/E)XK-type phosphodiesterase [Defluviitaleaceae bacterium]|nr:DUF2161 family putative PD-(D/E)XK-type phosphodiesterase [Defluviitaleaceae bacterium]